MSTFIDFARAHGLEINPSKLYPREKIQRCGTTAKPKSGNGAYFWDGERGWVFDWSGEATVQWYNDPHAKPWTEADKEAWKRKRQAAKHAQEEEYRRAAVRAQNLISTCKPGPHDYLASKGFQAEEGLIDPEGALVIPMRHVQTGELMGTQRILWDGERFQKKMSWGMRARGAVHWLGDRRSGETCIVEGFATGMSVRHATRSAGLNIAVLVTFSAHNLTHVAPLLHGKRYIYADNDESGTGEASAKATGLPYVMSDTVGNDANDDMLLHHPIHVLSKVVAVRRSA